jgi:signal peptidase I
MSDEHPTKKLRSRIRTACEAGGVVAGLLFAYFTHGRLGFHDTVAAWGFAALCAIGGALAGSIAFGWLFGKPQVPEKGKKGDGKSADQSDEGHFKAIRETAESIVIAFILAFLFRAFAAEAFVIPTGSMAPTLMGLHKDMVDPMSSAPYQAGASGENEDNGGPRSLVIGTRGPYYRYTTRIGHVFDERSRRWKVVDPAHRSFSGDRIIVSKFAYEFADPRRWDVIVFKYPGNAKQNYIKRLVGLPEETIRIRHGDLFVKRPGESKFSIARKPPHKLKAMLQRVDDTKFIPQILIDSNWPRRWQPWPSPDSTPESPWESLDGGREFRIKCTEEPSTTAWLRYRHLVPTPDDWRRVLGESVLDISSRPDDAPVPELIGDYYAYNDSITTDNTGRLPPGYPIEQFHDLEGTQQQLIPFNAGLHWVGDLAIQVEVTVENESGYLWLQLVEGGRFHRCRIDVKTGLATLTINTSDDRRVPFTGDDGAPGPAELVAETRVRGPGSYRLRFANCDDQLRLWVNERVQPFCDAQTGKASEAAYANDPDCRPVYNGPAEPADLMPVALGSQGASLHVERIRVLRDIYYIADDTQGSLHDYERWKRHLVETGEIPEKIYERQERALMNKIRTVLQTPTDWAASPMFDKRSQKDFSLEKDQFFPLGDNSPQSKDGRLWREDRRFVDRRFLTGKALFIYWPHSWDRPVPFFPNFQRMGYVR